MGCPESSRPPAPNGAPDRVPPPPLPAPPLPHRHPPPPPTRPASHRHPPRRPRADDQRTTPPVPLPLPLALALALNRLGPEVLRELNGLLRRRSFEAGGRALRVEG